MDFGGLDFGGLGLESGFEVWGFEFGLKEIRFVNGFVLYGFGVGNDFFYGCFE